MAAERALSYRPKLILDFRLENIDYIMTKTIQSFRDLIVWQEGHKLVLMIYKTTESFPSRENYSLVDQMRRAVLSITSNIAEGFGRHSYLEKIHFYYLAKGSSTELENQLLVAKDLSYLSDENYQTIYKQLVSTQQLLQGLIKKSKEISSLNTSSQKSLIKNH